MSLHGGCILVASGSPIVVFPIQCVLKHCGVHKHSLYIGHPSWWASPASWGIKGGPGLTLCTPNALFAYHN